MVGIYLISPEHRIHRSEIWLLTFDNDIKQKQRSSLRKPLIGITSVNSGRILASQTDDRSSRDLEWQGKGNCMSRYSSSQQYGLSLRLCFHRRSRGLLRLSFHATLYRALKTPSSSRPFLVTPSSVYDYVLYLRTYRSEGTIGDSFDH